jgi:acetyl esterase/lipase
MMSLANLDPELRPVLEAFASMPLDFSAGGLQQMRDAVRTMLESVPPRRPPSLRVEDVSVPGPPGDPDVVLRIYRPVSSSGPVPVLYWMHGGGMVMGSFDMDDTLLVGAAEQLGLAVVSVEYRLAPEHPDPAPVEDCYAGLVWTVANAARYGFDPQRIAVGGVSAGGGLAAGTALLARDRGGPFLAYQLLLEPMLDDRAITKSSMAFADSVVWNRHDNRFGWTALLGSRIGTDDVSAYAAPARATELDGLPAAWVDVGEVETFRDESINYAQDLLSAGVSAELHVYPGAFHGFDLIAPDSALARKAWAMRWAALARALGLSPPADPHVPQ